MKFLFHKKCLAGVMGALLLGAPAIGFSEPELAPPVAAVGPASELPVAIQNARWHMMDAGINTLTFRAMDTLFTTRTVARAGAVSELPRRDSELDFSYEFEGNTYPAEAALDRTYSNALLIMKDGEIVYENYLNNSDDDTRFIAWSATKSLVSLLVGIAHEEGLIPDLDADITTYLPELGDGAYNGVTIRQILQMRSGVNYEERYDFANPGLAATNHILALVKNVARFADMAKKLERKHEPGTVFEYKTIDTAVLGWLLERATQRSLAAYMSEKLWEPLGAEFDGFFIMDGEPGVGREFSGAGFNATLRDMARVGQLMLNEGRINGRRILSPEWVRESVKPAGDESAFMDYGYQWWTFSGTSAYAAIGLQGQFVYIDPATRTVIAKFSYFPPLVPEDAASRETFAFFRAASAWQPE